MQNETTQECFCPLCLFYSGFDWMYKKTQNYEPQRAHVELRGFKYQDWKWVWLLMESKKCIKEVKHFKWLSQRRVWVPERKTTVHWLRLHYSKSLSLRSPARVFYLYVAVVFSVTIYLSLSLLIRTSAINWPPDRSALCHWFTELQVQGNKESRGSFKASRWHFGLSVFKAIFAFVLPLWE